jgi:uncharacterized protein
MEASASIYLRLRNSAIESSQGGLMSYYLLFYDVAPDYLSRRPAYREEHLRLARAAQARGELVLAGAMGDPPDGAVLVFRTSGPDAIKTFAEKDPYVINGLVVRWRIKP